MTLDRNLIEYLPPILQDVREYKGIMYTEQDEFSNAWDAADEVFNAQFVNDTTEESIKRWEKVLSITPKASATLDDRKFAIITRINESVPYTMTTVRQVLDTLCGTDGYSIVLDNDNYMLTVKIDRSVRNQFDAVNDLLNRVVPMNLVLDLKLLYNTHEVISGYTHDELSAQTHEYWRIEVL